MHQPISDVPATKTQPVANIPAIIDKPTTARESSAVSTALPIKYEAILSPSTPPTKELGNRPIKMNNTSPTVAPMYKPFFEVYVFIFVASFLIFDHNKAGFVPSSIALIFRDILANSRCSNLHFCKREGNTMHYRKKRMVIG
jgi:hypothetical protein